MTTLTAAQVAALMRKVGFPESDLVTMVAVCKAESGFRVEAKNPSSSASGLLQILWSVHRNYDQRRLLSDAEYNIRAGLDIYRSQGKNAWVAYSSGAYKKYVNEARQGVAQAASVNGNAAIPATADSSGTSQPAITYGPNGPQIVNAGVGVPLAAEDDVSGPLSEFFIRGTQVGGDFAASIIGAPTYEAGIDIVPNVGFSIVDEDARMLSALNNQGYFWSRGGTVTYRDAIFKIDTVKFEPGTHTTGQITVTCADDIVYALMNLKGPRTASGISATEWIQQELRLAGIDPNLYFLGESVPSQSMIARDEADQTSTSGSGEDPSAWTTIVRLAKELGKRVFISGRRLIFGSAQFAMAWAAPGSMRISMYGYTEGERFITMPTATRVTVGSRDVAQVTGRVPLNRAKFFRPGTSVLMTQIPNVAGLNEIQMMVQKISHDIANDTDGAEITFLEPVDPPPQPPTQTTAAGANGGSTSADGSSGGGADGSIDKFISIALSQAGKRYVFGAEASPSDANPRAFDCSELVEWSAARAGINPKVPDGSSAQLAHSQRISVQAGINTKGALLFMPGHVAISLGNGKTIEAMNPSSGVRQGNANGRSWSAAGKIPGATGYR